VVRDGVVLAEAAEPESRTHVVSLPALVERALAEAGLGIRDVEGLAISIGPGSFTGLRIGLGLAKGIAFAGGLPVASVPTLEALARAADGRPGQTVCAALDARKGEVYAAMFRLDASGDLERLGPDAALPPARLAAALPAGAVLVGDAAEAYPEAWPAALERRSFATHHPRGGIVARMGALRLAAGDAADLGALEPVYVRPPEAELARMKEPGVRGAR
jgi:tRNA threonylcarbamoyladenosine biosynthesis protein TsaB